MKIVLLLLLFIVINIVLLQSILPHVAHVGRIFVYVFPNKQSINQCNKRMPIMLKEPVYKSVIRPHKMYGGETWALRKAEQNLLERTEMRMLRWMIKNK